MVSRKKGAVCIDAPRAKAIGYCKDLGRIVGKKHNCLIPPGRPGSFGLSILIKLLE